MSGAVVSVLVLGITCAANPWGIMIAVLLLRARRRGVVWAYVLAWVASLSLGLAVLVAGFGAALGLGSSSASTAAAVVELLLGAALAVWGAQRILEDRRGTAASVAESAEPAVPGWMRAIESISYIPAFLLGIYSATWPTVIAAAGEIARAGGSPAQTVGLCVLFVVVGSSTVVGVAAIGTFSNRSDELLNRLHRWLTAHNRTVITAIVLGLGVLLVVRGLGELL